MKILSGTSNLNLSKKISKNLKLKLINTNIKRFADGEIYIEINENIRGNSVFVIQSTSNPANDNIMEFISNRRTKKIFSKNYNCCNSIFWICKTG